MAATRSRSLTPAVTVPGSAKTATGWAWPGYPALRVMALAETGTRGLLGATIGSATDRYEAHLARRLLHLLGPGMLVLLDRAFDGNAFLAEVHAARADAVVPRQVRPHPRGAAPPARRLLPVPPGQPGRAHHRG